MVDYGHPLRFGSFITPSAGTPSRTVDLAVVSEEAGLDLVTFQDHPYQPAFLDTWTLLSYVAARTSAVRLAPNVANLPLRQPAVIARSAASLDLLSEARQNHLRAIIDYNRAQFRLFVALGSPPPLERPETGPLPPAPIAAPPLPLPPVTAAPPPPAPATAAASTGTRPPL